MNATILLGHGGGGRLMKNLIEDTILPRFRNSFLETRHDGALLPVGDSRVAFTTDSYVVRPWAFPGGDIGSLAVIGTVNDLAMCGARPAWLSAALILEEGFPLASLTRVLDTMRRTADLCGVEIVTGDTKVVDHGKGDGIYINTAGIGVVDRPDPIGPSRIQPGDAILLSGDVGRHGIAVLAAREGFDFETRLESDVAPLTGPVLALLAGGIEVHGLRDLTRGGLAAALVELAETTRLPITVEEALVPVIPEVRGVCELLGLDPLHVACEGRFIAFLPGRDVAKALEILRSDPVSEDAVRIGTVSDGEPGRVVLETTLRTLRVVDLFSGEQLPRIC
jgi:hydrogenase expression/formation protein HypE